MTLTPDDENPASRQAYRNAKRIIFDLASSLGFGRFDPRLSNAASNIQSVELLI
ncbi:hypothetical protein SLT36_15825 [Aminobacter sp. BA135]|uniref:hypothetical protein n=1 Tax=Aminobacter sp. BA135 TaxID=537596 RepID=UPI003D7A7AB7